jgi:RND family efflux transporter MFP subunit
MKKLLIILGLIFLGAIGAACTTSAQSATANATQNATATRGNISQQIAPSGNMVMSRAANLSFKTGGTVKEVLVDIGDTVKTGQVLAKLDTVKLDQALIQAQINVKNAQLTLNTALTPTLNSSGALASSPDALDIEIKTLQLENAKLSLKNIENQLTNAVIVAPFDGVIAQATYLSGDSVGPNTVIVRMFDPTQVIVNALVNEMDIYQVKIGQQATIQMNALSSISLTATVYAISPSANMQGGVVNYPVKMRVNLQPQTRTVSSPGLAGTPGSTNGTSPFPAGASANATDPKPGGFPGLAGTPGSNNGTSPFPGISANATSPRPGSSGQNTLPTLKEGLTVTISLPIQQRNNVILVPNRAVTRQGSKSIVNVILADGTTEQRLVTTGLSNSQQIEIKEGLKEGEKVVVLPATVSNPFGQPPGGMMGIR